MSATPIDKLESQLEALVEGAFARLRRGAISARDLALLLLRAMEEGAAKPGQPGHRPTAPDLYLIQLHPENATQFLARSPELSQRLAHFIANLSDESGYRLAGRPRIEILPNRELSLVDAVVTAEFSAVESMPTKPMKAVKEAEEQPDATAPWLEIGGGDARPLEKSIINIGRETDNDIVIADAYVSRYHLQLRRRGGAYTLFDINSRGGTRVNGVALGERRLAHGDVISIGRTALVYQGARAKDLQHGTTQVMHSD